MNTDFELRHWESVKGRLKSLFPQLTDSDLIWRHETKNDMFKTIATKLVMPKKELTDIVDSL